MIEHLIIALTTGFQAFLLWLLGRLVWTGSAPTLRHGVGWLAGWCVEMFIIVAGCGCGIIGAEVLKQWLLDLLQ